MESIYNEVKSNFAQKLYGAIFEDRIIPLDEGEKLCDLLDANKLEEAIKKFKDLLCSATGCPCPI